MNERERELTEVVFHCEGVISAKVNLLCERAEIVFDPSRAKPESFVEEIEAIGYDAK